MAAVQLNKILIDSFGRVSWCLYINFGQHKRPTVSQVDAKEGRHPPQVLDEEHRRSQTITRL